MKKDKFRFNPLLLVLTVGFLVRLISINQSLWMDEAISAYAVKSFSFMGIINDFILSDTHPPLYYLLLEVWTSIFGYSEASLRLLSVIFSTLSIYVIYRIGLYWDKKTAFYAAILAAFSPLLIYYSQEARMYSLTTLLVSCVIYFFIQKKWVLYSLTLLLLSMTDYFPLLILIPVWISALLKKVKISTKPFILAHIPLILFLMFWYPVFSRQSTETMKFVRDLPAFAKVLGVSDLKNLALVWVKFLIGRISFNQPLIYGGIVLLVTTLVLIPLRRSIKEYKKLIVLWLWFVVPISAAFLFAFKVPGFSYFRLIFALPALILLISYGLARSGSKILFYMILSSEIIFSSIYFFNRDFWREDWKNAVPFIESRIKPGEKVMFSYKEMFTPYTWYSEVKDNSISIMDNPDPKYEGIYTLDYLMDLTDPGREYYQRLETLGYRNMEVNNFRGVGQVRYWIKN